MEIIKGNHFIRNEEILPTTDFNPYILKEGHSIYEVIRMISGIPLFMEEHLERFEQSAKKTNHQLNIARSEIWNRTNKLIHTCKIEAGNFKMVVKYQGNEADISDFYAYFIPHHYPSEEDYLHGVDTISYYAERSNPNAKVANLTLNSKVQQEIKQHNVYEALLLDHNSYITEGSRSNVFMVQDDKIFTAPLQNVLPGITRGFVLDVCQKLGLTVMERNIKLDELINMEALFLTGTSPNVLPIKKVDHLNFNSATHQIVQNIMHKYNNLIKDYIHNYHPN